MIPEEKMFTKERKYNKIDSISRLNGGNTKGTNGFAKEYQQLQWQARVKQAALNSSDNGRCWWIHDYIIGTTINIPKKQPLANHTGVAKELYPRSTKR